jgi:hypothetical protein
MIKVCPPTVLSYQFRTSADCLLHLRSVVRAAKLERVIIELRHRYTLLCMYTDSLAVTQQHFVTNCIL